MPILSADDYAFYDGMDDSIIAIAHRGGGDRKFPENSMNAFQHSHDLGYRYMETDVVETRDGVLLVYHGPDKKDGLDSNGLPHRSVFQSMGYSEIKDKYKIGERKETIPKLDDLICSFQSTRFYIDPKTNESVPLLVESIKKHKAEERVSVQAFSRKRNRDAVKMLGGWEKISTNHGRLGASMVLLLQFYPTSKVSNMYYNIDKAPNINLPHKYLTKTMTRRIKENGMKVFVWAQGLGDNDSPEFQDNAIGLGVSGILTDHTTSLKEKILKAQPNNKSFYK